ncbi:hypothetical protein GAYE_PCTG44G1080 [Galdieria yellowstonensis]|uniref:C-terminal processing peptidase n=1 Tax=Galdieria yellowstonensis TaxID=3028027 RepID=A0AAV9I3J1_9RHOD|nr:hypothetical protein GAYE_PCTG44G1080 [Galdieria yellowstonensis]
MAAWSAFVPHAETSIGVSQTSFYGCVLLHKRHFNHYRKVLVIAKPHYSKLVLYCCQQQPPPPKDNRSAPHEKKTTDDSIPQERNTKLTRLFLSHVQRLQTFAYEFMSKPLIIPKNVAILVVTVLLVITWNTYPLLSSRFPSEEDLEPLQQKVALFNIILKDIQRAYVEQVNVDKLFETGVNAMLGSLDPYTQFENNVEAQEMNVKALGRYGGVGLVIAKDVRDKNQIIVVSSFERYAFDAGLRPGDRLLVVDGHPVAGQDLETLTHLLRGEAGTSVTVTVARPGISEPFQVTLKRQVIRVSDVPAYGFIGDQRDGVGYIRLQSFSSNACAQVKSAMQELQKGGNLKSLVLDLRDNPGGLLSSAVDVAELFVPKGSTIVSIKGRLLQERQYQSKKMPLLSPNVRLGVLVNSRTASAAEIVAGAIQDNDLGVVFGSQTFGKGLVQNVDQLPFQTALKYTVGKYYTPSGRCIQSSSYSSDHERLKITAIHERKVFQTKNGRDVLDNGGIEPDIPWEETAIPEWRRLLHQQGLLFYFANDYAATHPKGIGPDFYVDDELFAQFKKYVKEQVAHGPFSISSRFEEPLASLRSELEQQGYRETSKNLEKVSQSLKSEMENELERFDAVIRHDLEDAIRARFQPDSVRIMASLLRDEEIVKAKQVVSDGLLYAKLLSPPQKKAV